MTITQMKMATLYERLAQIGFKKNFIDKKALPDWWRQDCESTPGAVIEGATYISRRLNLELDSLLDINKQPRFKNLCQPKFKKQQNTENEDLKVSHYLAARIAELTAYACKTQYQPIDHYSVTEIRTQILSRRKYVDLEGILEFCWRHGVPVIHFNEFPKGIKKFHGMVACFNIDIQPVITISLNDASPSRLAFILAHELGHIYKNHLDGKFLVDEKIELDSDDMEEVQANEFAIELLFGKPDMIYYKAKVFNGNQLASYAKNISERDSVDPGSIIWNYAWNKKDWAVARKGVKIIEGDANAPIIINGYLRNYLDWSKLNDDNQEYLALMTGLEIEDIVGE
jgi:hypothetical protein